MKEWRVLIADDEAPARIRLARLVQELPGYRLCGEAENGHEVMEQIARETPDIVLMDIRMPGMDGMAAARRLASLETPPALIFCTAYEDYALDAIGLQAAAYLLKPVSRQALKDALDRAGRVNRLQRDSLADNGGDRSAPLSVRTHRGVELIDLNQIRYCQADSKYVTIIHQDGETITDFTLKQLEADYPDLFLRIHRNTLVSRRYLGGLVRGEDGQYQVRLKDDEHTLLPVSRRHVASTRQSLRDGH